LDSKYNPTTELSKRYTPPNSLPTGDQHKAQQLTADYLGALKRHLRDILKIQLGEHEAKETPLQFILTVPAVWSDAAKEKTLQTAEAAGLGQNAPILMISEPVGVWH
jgi:molecular chaperone DnaK (HSP70)